MTDLTTPPEVEKAFFSDLFNNVANAWNNGNRQPYLDRLSDNAVYMIPNSELLIGKQAINEFVSGFPEVAVQFSVVEVWGNATLVNLRGAYMLNDLQGNLIDKGKFINLFSKGNSGTWKVTHDIWNSDLPLPE